MNTQFGSVRRAPLQTNADLATPSRANWNGSTPPGTRTPNLLIKSYRTALLLRTAELL